VGCAEWGVFGVCGGEFEGCKVDGEDYCVDPGGGGMGEDLVLRMSGFGTALHCHA
jgi:hypothetical protein